MSVLPPIFLTVVLLTAVTTDLRSRRIPNWLVYPSMVVGIVYNTWVGGINGLFFSLQGLGLAVLLLVFFYIAGGMGAGDVKLMGAVGSFLGPLDLFRAFLYVALVGGIYALIIIIRVDGFKGAIKRSGLMIVNLYSKITYKPVCISCTEREETPALYYGVAIALGTFLSMLGYVREFLF